MFSPTVDNLFLAHLVIDGDVGSPTSSQSIRVTRGGIIDIGGDCYARIIANNQVSGASHNIPSVNIDGDLLGGGIYNKNGSVDITSIGGSALIYSSNAPQIWASTTLGSIEIAGDAEMQIGSNGVGFAGHPDVTSVSIGGDFLDPLSPMTMDSLGTLTVDGHFEPVLNVTSAMSSGSLYIIGGSLVTGAEINLPSSGLQGQVIINGDDVSGAWVGDVVVGATTLAPVYSNTASSLGGGSVGRVPFEAHRTDSVPALNTNLSFSTSAVTPSYDIRHYGPVTFDDQADPLMPIRLQRRAICVGEQWLNVTGEWAFTYAVNSGSDTIIDMDAGQSAYYRNGNEYRFVAETDTGEDDVLLCDLGLLSDPAVADYPTDAWFTVGSLCPWDTNEDGNTNVDELNIVLGEWNMLGDNLEGDINTDGEVGVDDLNLVLSHWNETQCMPCGGSLLGGGESPDATALMAELGYGSVAEFCDELSEMDAEEQEAMLAALLVAASE